MTEETTKLARVIYRAANGSVRNGAERLTMAAAERIARCVREPVLMAPAFGVTVRHVLRGLGPFGDTAGETFMVTDRQARIG
jgi:hypothetical protein